MITVLVLSLVLTILMMLVVMRLVRGMQSAWAKVLVVLPITVVAFVVFLAAGSTIYVFSSIKPPKSFDARNYHGQIATITTTLPGEISVLMSKPGDRDSETRYSGGKGKINVPVGSYQIQEYNSTIIRGSESTQVSGRYTYPVPLPPLTSGAGVDLPGGGPFTASVNVKERGSGSVTLDFVLTGTGGESCTLSNSRGDKPGFQILSQNGEVLQTGTFEYG